MVFVNIPGITPTLLSAIMAQATVILIACSIVLSLLRDLYEDKRIPIAGITGEPTRAAPLLESRSAQRLRWFLRWFVIGLALFYAVLALAIVGIELWPNNDGDVFVVQFPRAGVTTKFSLQDVYTYATRAHFVIVVIVGLIVACMGRIRDHEARRRWRDEAL